MSRSYFLRNSLILSAAVSLTLAGCASSAKLASNDIPKEVAAASAKNAGFWGRVKSWMPKAAIGVPANRKIQNPGKLHLAYATWQEKLGNLVEARESYELALGDNPKSADAILGLARLDQLNNRTFEAEQRYLTALKLKPNDPNTLDAVGQFYASQERWSKSIKLLSQAVQVAPQETSHRFHLAVALARAGRVGEAMPHFSQTVGDAEAHYNVGYILYQQNDLVGAERHLLQAVVSSPKLAQAQQMLDEVRRGQADRTMFAGGRPAVDRNVASGKRTADAGRVQPAAANYDQPRNGRENNYRNVIPATSAGDTARQDYRLRYQPPRDSRMNSTPVNSNPAPVDTNLDRSPPPWHTSPDFGRTQVPTGRPAQSQVPANRPPGTSQPTPEQLEQMRNQFAPTGDK